jgi:segregation and condensation protein B
MDESAIQIAEDTAPASSVDLDASARIVEALLLAADGPLSLDALQRFVGAELNLSRKDLRDALLRLSERYADSAAQLCEVASGWRLQVRPEFGEWVSRLWQEKPPKYSRAALETLALVVYRQPITRGEIEDIRGVAVSTNILRTLLERGWVREVGVKESPGRPSLYGTTSQFLDDFNLKSLDQLPALPEIKDLEQLEAAMNKLGLATELTPAKLAENANEGTDKNAKKTVIADDASVIEAAAETLATEDAAHEHASDDFNQSPASDDVEASHPESDSETPHSEDASL